MAAVLRYSRFWIRPLLVAGGALAVALLAQTIVNYQYVSTNLIRQEARRVGEERVRNVERSARASQPRTPEAYRVILDDLKNELPDQIAAIALLHTDGTIVAEVGPTSAVASSEERQRAARGQVVPLRSERQDGRAVLIAVLPCRCTFPRQAPGAEGRPMPGRLVIEIALYQDSLSTPFARVRRNAAISASAALALLISVILIGLRFGPYVRGKQLEAQLDVARQVQRDLLPAAEAFPPGIDVAAECVPASEVGGDFYDIVSLPGGRVAFTLGDVSGHGISAALLMGLIHGAMSSPPWGVPENEPDRAAAHLNHLLLTKSSGERFASLFWCSFDPRSSTLRYLNAGHPPPLWVRPGRNDTLDRLAEGGPVLGLLPDATYQAASVTAQENDLLVLFSDGIVEVVDSRGEPFGEGRLLAVVETHRDAPTRAICDAILSEVTAFATGRPAQDDQTVLVVRLWAQDREVAEAPAAASSTT